MKEALTPQDTWDWTLLYYVGTVMLHMSPGLFWKCTPRKLQALISMHLEIQKPTNKKNKADKAFIDQVL